MDRSSEQNTNPYSFVEKNREAKPYLSATLAIARDSSYSVDYRREAIRPHVEAMYKLYTDSVQMKSYVYYDEKTKIDFPVDFVLQCVMRQHSPVELLNAYMKDV